MPVFSIQKWMFVTEKKRSDLQGFRFNHYTVDVWIYFYSGASEFASHGYLDLFSDCMYNMQICKGYKFKTKKKKKKFKTTEKVGPAPHSYTPYFSFTQPLYRVLLTHPVSPFLLHCADGWWRWAVMWTAHDRPCPRMTAAHLAA